MGGLGMEVILLIDFGSTYTKVTAVDPSVGRIVGTGRAYTTVEQNIMLGLERAIDGLLRSTGQNLTFTKKLACSSAAGGLRMVAIGLVRDLTVEAASRAALGAGAKVLQVYSNRLNDSEIHHLELLAPDIILLAGGTDGGNSDVVVHNARALAQSNLRAPVVMAGNKVAVDQVNEVLVSNNKEVRVCSNVMPELNVLDIEPARQTIREVFMEKIVEAKGLAKAEEFVEGVLMPTPAAVLAAGRLLAEGTEAEPGIGELMVVDIGGATTDVHSIAAGQPTRTGVSLKGLPEPFVKRTVEGDLGMRYSLPTLLEKVNAFPELYESVEAQRWERYLARTQQEPEWLAENELETQLETIMAQVATRIAVERHVGQLEIVYTPFGVAYLQTGKDLTTVPWIVGTGGVIVEHQRPKVILEQARFCQETPMLLKPQQPEYLVDRQYIMAAMGLLAEVEPRVALKILKSTLQPA